MKYFLFTLLLISSVASLGQNDSLPPIPEWMGNDCERGEKIAVSDTAKGMFKIYSFGLMVSYGVERKFAEYYKKFLEEKYGWDGLSMKINIRCFQNNPSVNSSLKFLRKTPWARAKVEELYMQSISSK